MMKDNTVKRILMVCTGNTCRSPMAEQLLRAALAKRGLGSDRVQISSAGLAANPGAPMALPAQQVLAEDYQLDGSRHRARLLDADLISAADLILTMNEADAIRLREAAPLQADRIRALDPQAAILDPWGGPLPAYRATARRLSELVNDMADQIRADTPK